MSESATAVPVTQDSHAAEAMETRLTNRLLRPDFWAPRDIGTWPCIFVDIARDELFFTPRRAWRHHVIMSHVMIFGGVDGTSSSKMLSDGYAHERLDVVGTPTHLM